MKRARLAVGAALALTSAWALAQNAPESLLPPGFDEPVSQPAPAPDRPYVVTLRLDFDNTGAVDVARQLRSKIGVVGDQPGKTENGRVRLYVIGQGALGAAAQTSTKQDIAAAERWNLPIVLIVLVAVFGSLAAAKISRLSSIGTTSSASPCTSNHGT